MLLKFIATKSKIYMYLKRRCMVISYIYTRIMLKEDGCFKGPSL
jgi:hypothetical protein